MKAFYFLTALMLLASLSARADEDKRHSCVLRTDVDTYPANGETREIALREAYDECIKDERNTRQRCQIALYLALPSCVYTPED